MNYWDHFINTDEVNFALETCHNKNQIFFKYFWIYSSFSLELNMELPQQPTGTQVGTATASQEQDELSQRLARLRQAE